MKRKKNTRRALYEQALEQAQQGKAALREINKLAEFIIQEIPGEPSRSESAVATAIRLLRGAIPQPVRSSTAIVVG